MGLNLTQKILAAHTTALPTQPGEPLPLRIDQTLTQDATGTMAWLQFEALGVATVKTELSVSYVDHNTLQMGFRNPDDHRFLQTAAARFGAVYSPPGTGICHQLHLENFARPGATLLGSDSHTPTAGGVGSLAIGAGGLSVALAMAGQAYTLPMPAIVRVYLEGALTGWATAKDIILHMLKTLTVKGGVGKIFEYCGPGVATLTVPERATITNMGAELGATSSIFPSDEQTRQFLRSQGREDVWVPLQHDENARWDEEMSIDLSSIVPLVAQPHMPDNVVTVASLDGLVVDQVAIGSCTNSSYADLALVADILDHKQVSRLTDTTISPGSSQVLQELATTGKLNSLLASGARLLECACGPCIGMGGSPITHGVSLRTFNRNFEGRSGTKDAAVYLASPATAAMAALHGKITDPATWPTPPQQQDQPQHPVSIKHLFIMPPKDGQKVRIERGPNIVPLESFPPLDETLQAQVIITLGDNITTDHIMPAGAEITALRSNIPAIAQHVFGRVDSSFAERAKKAGNGIIVAGYNYGQGSSREHAALAPRHLGIRAVLACSLARIHRANLINFGILPLTFAHAQDLQRLNIGDTLTLQNTQIQAGQDITIMCNGTQPITVTHDLSQEEIAIIQAGGLLAYTAKHMPA